MSAETATLAAVLRVEQEVARLHRRIEVMEAERTPWPNLLTTSQAMVYARVSRRTLNRWLSTGRLSDLGAPRRWSRQELDRCLAGSAPLTGGGACGHS